MKLSNIIAAFICLILTGPLCSGLERWKRTDNETMYRDMLSYVRSIQDGLVGDPAYYCIQDFIVEVQAAHIKDEYAWMGQTHRLCNNLEKMYPPVLEHSQSRAEDRYAKFRKDILMLRDYPLHQQSIVEDGIVPPAVQVEEFNNSNRQYLQLKRDEFFRFLSSPRPADGSLQIVKLYSSGFVFRTTEACVALDINYDLYSDDRKDELFSQIDVLFNTHGHGDHYNLPLMRQMVKAGKPLVMAKDVIKDTDGPSKIVWNEGHESMADICMGVKAQARMGAQGTEPCLIFIIQIGNWRIAAHGDNSQLDKEIFYEDKEMVDVMCAPVWQGVETFSSHVLKMPNPGEVAPVYISAHENEYHHDVYGRISYKAFYETPLRNLYSKNPCHVVVMDCGENLTLNK